MRKQRCQADQLKSATCWERVPGPGRWLVHTERLIYTAHGGTFRSPALSHTPQERSLPLAAFHSPWEMDKHNQGQHPPGSCLEIRLSLGANQLWSWKVHITNLSLPRITTVGLKDPFQIFPYLCFISSLSLAQSDFCHLILLNASSLCNRNSFSLLQLRDKLFQREMKPQCVWRKERKQTKHIFYCQAHKTEETTDLLL